VRVATTQTVFSLSCVLFFSRNDNHHHPTHRIANTLPFSYHFQSGSLLTRLASQQHPSGASVAAAVPAAHDQISITFTLFYFCQRQAICPTPHDHESLKGVVFYFLKAVNYLHLLQATETLQSVVFSFPALSSALSTETTVGK